MTPADQAVAKACCADLYQSDVARMLFGDSIHPGGLALTNRMAQLMGVQPGDLVLDLASGPGTSALALSRVRRCRVVGVEFGAQATAKARDRFIMQPGGALVSFVRGDAEALPLRSGAFDSVMCECSMSLFPDKAAAASEVTRALRPGGRFGLSDVSLAPGSLPEELSGTLGQMLCLMDALDVNGYVDLLESAGLALLHREDASHEVTRILDEVEAKLGLFSAWSVATGWGDGDSSILDQAPGLIATVRKLVQDGILGYWVFVAENPD